MRVRSHISHAKSLTRAACHLYNLEILKGFVNIACISLGMVHYFVNKAKTIIYYYK